MPSEQSNHSDFRARFRALLMRRNTAFLALGAVYVRTPRFDQEIQSELNKSFPRAPQGQAFVRWGLRRRKSSTLGILIAGVGRLGNSVLQSLNIRSIGQALGSASGYYHRFDAIGNQTLQFGENFSLRRLPLFGFGVGTRPNLLWRTYALDSEFPLDDPESETSGQVRNALRKAILGNISQSARQASDTLTVYLRSGDVFSEEPEPHYGQPPWAFFERVLEFRPWTKVIVVSEDPRNPVHDLVLSWCQRRGVSVEAQGSSLQEAVRAVVAASSLTSANGTFVPSLLFLDDGEKDVFCFQESENPFLHRRGLTVWEVNDIEGLYLQNIMSRNWRNSEAQKRLMAEYPKTSLSRVRLAKA